jgi:hypothetical protein
MRTLAFLFASLFLAPLVRANASPGVLADQVVDRVWSGHPVGFAFLTERGHQFIACYDAERRITVAGLVAPEFTQPGIEVQTLTSRSDGRFWVLRWETLPRNRDLLRKNAPSASRLRLIELPPQC